MMPSEKGSGFRGTDLVFSILSLGKHWPLGWGGGGYTWGSDGTGKQRREDLELIREALGGHGAKRWH